MHLMNDAHILHVRRCQQSDGDDVDDGDDGSSNGGEVLTLTVANVRVVTDLVSLLPNILWLSTTSSGLPSQH